MKTHPSEKPFNSTNDVSIFLKFDHFDTEYSYDFVEVYDGPIESVGLKYSDWVNVISAERVSFYTTRPI